MGEAPVVAQYVLNSTSVCEDVGLIPGLAQWVGCRELWGRSQTRLGSGIAVAVAVRCSSDLPPSLCTCICCRGST